MTPAQKAIALLVTNPHLATLEANCDTWLEETDMELRMMGRLLKVLHDRPHYSLYHLLSYWPAVYGGEEAKLLAEIAGNDLLQAANALTLPRQDKPAKTDYDTEAAFKGCLETLHRQQKQKITALSLEKLKNADFTQLSKAERDALVHAALRSKIKTTQDGEK